ncbi:MAG: topoisomerase IV, partial [Clostridiales bacterium]|nr:topoisomerase IV [Clostridiales bacterium]
DAEVVPNLMIGFGIDQAQAEYVADIRLRNINKEYILRRTRETSDLEREIDDLQDTLRTPARIRTIIAGELADVKKKYAVPRRTDIIYEHQMKEEPTPEEEIPDYPVHMFCSQQGYFKKITPASLRMSGEQKYKEGDAAFLQWEGTNQDELLIFTDRQQCYKTRASDFEDSKASLLGDFLPTKLGMDAGETVVWACPAGDYSAHVLFFFQNGKAARVPLSAYQTQTRRKKLTGAYSDKSPLAAALLLSQDMEVAVRSTEGRCAVFHTAALAPKATRSVQGVLVMTLKPRYQVEGARPLAETPIVNVTRYRARRLPAAGALLREEDRGEQQLSLTE